MAFTDFSQDDYTNFALDIIYGRTTQISNVYDSAATTAWSSMISRALESYLSEFNKGFNSSTLILAYLPPSIMDVETFFAEEVPLSLLKSANKLQMNAPEEKIASIDKMVLSFFTAQHSQDFRQKLMVAEALKEDMSYEQSRAWLNSADSGKDYHDCVKAVRMCKSINNM
jgi:hypothetical protein